MEEAKAAGGLDAFESKLLQELASPRATHRFRPPHPVAATSTSTFARTLQEPLASHPTQLATTSASASTPASTLTTGLYAAALDVTSAEGGENLFGRAMTLTGLAPTPNTSQDEVDALVNALGNLQSSLNSLASQVGTLTELLKSTATLNEYNTIVTAAQPLAVDVTNVEQDISYFAQWCPPLAAGQTPDPENEQWCLQWAPVYKAELQTSYENKDFENLQGYIADNGTLGTEGMLHLYSLWLAQSKQFFRPADSTKMQNLYDYWNGVLTSAANLRMEYFHVQGDQNSPLGSNKLSGSSATLPPRPAMSRPA